MSVCAVNSHQPQAATPLLPAVPAGLLDVSCTRDYIKCDLACVCVGGGFLLLGVMVFEAPPCHSVCQSSVLTACCSCVCVRLIVLPVRQLLDVGCFPLGAITSTATMNIPMPVFGRQRFSFFLGWYLEIEQPGHMMFLLRLLKKLQTVFQSGWTMYIPTSNVQNIYLHIPASQHLLFSAFFKHFFNCGKTLT